MAQYLSKNVDISVQGFDDENLVVWVKRRFEGKNYVIQSNITPKSKVLAYVTFGPQDRKEKYLCIRREKQVHYHGFDRSTVKDEIINEFGLSNETADVIVKELDDMYQVCLKGVREKD